MHRLRAWADAIVVGSGTVLADDPALTVRDAGIAGASAAAPGRRRRPGRVPADAAVFDRAAPTLVATTHRADRRCVDAWEAAGADVVFDTEAGGVSVALSALLAHLGKRDVQGVLVEGGPTLAWSFVREGLVDRVVLYLAPKFVGGPGAPRCAEGDGFAPIGEALAVRHRRRRAASATTSRWRPMFTGIVEERGGCSPSERSASWSRAAR